ncbi:MAG: hypothetical protein LQ338_006561 [Usnochroma carphineum]|nr:MAG: hypothetical protein LQ338_006561 [Usnochroma carphineum]
MADPLSVIGVLVAIAQITPAVVDFVKAYRHASSESRQLLLEVRSTSGVVLLLRDLADETSSADPWSTSLESLSELLEQYEALLKGLAHTLEASTRKRDALKWPFEKKAIGETLANIERYKTAFLLALQNVQIEVSYSIKCSMEDTYTDVRWLRENQQARDSETILQWLSPLDFKLMQNDTLHRRHADTGDWILQTPSFTSWAFGDLDTLCCEGIPGAGKTIIAAIVVDHLKRKVDMEVNTKRPTELSIGLPGSSVMCLYCMYKERTAQTAENLLGSFVKQLAESYPRQFFATVHELYQARKVSHERLALTDLVSMLESMLQSFRQSYIIVDALDECATDVKDSLMSSLEALQQICSLKVMVTLRPDTAITFLDPSKTGLLQIRAQKADMDKYLTARITSERRSFASIRGRPDMTALTIDTILARSQGMFLLARLHLDSVAKSPSPAILKTTLQGLPRQLNATYDEAILRIEDQDDQHANLAKKVLAWILYAWRSLTVLELQHALAAESTVPGQGVHRDHIISPEDIVYSCAGLVTLDQETKVIRMVHYSAQEYFSANRHIHFPNGHRDIAAVCLKYLASDLFSTGSYHDPAQLTIMREQNPFLDYAARYWGHHARDSGINGELLPEILSFLRSKPNLSIATQVASQEFLYYQLSRYSTDSPLLPPLLVVAHFGLSGVAAYLLDRGADINDEPPNDIGALAIATHGGFEAFVRLLIDRGVDVHEAQRRGITPLHRASSLNHPKIVEMLLQHDRSIIKARNAYGKTALHDAAERGFADVVEILLNFGANLVLRDNSAKTPLSYAAASGDIPTVRLLLGAGVPIDSSEPGTVQATYAAAASSQHSMLQFLFGEGAKIDSRGVHNNTILHGAVCGGGDPAIARLIMQQRNSHLILNSLNIHLKAPLHDAVERNRLASVSVLLEFDPEMGPDIDGRTPLHWAVWRNHVAMTRLLLEKRNDRTFINKRAGPKFKDMTALEMAVDKQHIEVIKLLSEAL